MSDSIYQALTQRDERVVLTEEFEQGDGSTIVVPNSGVPTQVANPVRATIRTAMAVLVGLVVALPTINSALLALQGFLNEQTDVVLPAWVWLVVNGAVLTVGLISGAITRLLAVPGVNEWVKVHVPALSAIPTVKTAAE